VAVIDKNNLTILAYKFNNDFKQFLASHDSLNSPQLKTSDTHSWYQRSIERLVDHPFKIAFRQHPAYKIFIRNVESVGLHSSFKNSHNDTWLLEIFLLRIVSGSIEVYYDPMGEATELHYQKQRQAITADLGNLIIPNRATAALAERLITKIKDSGAEIDWMPNLKNIADQKPYDLVRESWPFKALVREISILSKMLLDTSNGHAGRFPPSAIQNILEILNEDKTDEGIRQHQQKYDGYCGIYLSSGNLKISSD
tara:strand:+ start:288 stop:1049 length:762 start_codon:yes stop_codon:yes gene_type:complete